VAEKEVMAKPEDQVAETGPGLRTDLRTRGGEGSWPKDDCRRRRPATGPWPMQLRCPGADEFWLLMLPFFLSS